MSQDGKKKKTMRLILWGIMAALSIASVVLLFLNYKTLEQVTLFSEKSAVEQSKNYTYYVQEYKVTKIALDEANQKIVEMTQELEVANAELSSARSELSSVQQLNDQLKSSIAVLERYKVQAMAKGDSLETLIHTFKQKNRELDGQLQGVRKELAVFQPEISDTEEGRSKIKIFKNHIRLVKQNMGILKQEAQELRVVAQKERDRVESLYGNGGFMVKDGQDKSVTKFDEGMVNIDVKILNK